MEDDAREDESDLAPSRAAESGNINDSSRHLDVPDMPGSHIQPDACPSPFDETRVFAEADLLAAISPNPKPESSANRPLPEMRLDTQPATATSVGQLFGRISARRTESGGLVLEAPPEAAAELASLFEGMARLMTAMTAPTSTGLRTNPP